MRERCVVAFLSDTHGGHLLGLLNPNTRLIKASDDGSAIEWTPELNHTQRRLWLCYEANLAQIAAFAGEDEIVAVHDGDATQGDYRNNTIPDTTREDQREIAVQNLLPLVRLPGVRKARLETGTEIHVPENAEARIAWRLAKETGKDVRVYHHQRLSIDGVLFDTAHHGPPEGSRDWLRGNVAMLYLRDRVYRDRRLGRIPATVYVRGHYHSWVHVTLWDDWQGEHTRHDLIVVPSFCGLGEYGRKVTRSDPSLTTGFGVCEVAHGRLEQVLPFTQTWDLRTCESI